MRPLVLGVLLLLLDCAADPPPPPIGDLFGRRDGGIVPVDAGPTDPCDPPVAGCPCVDAGEQLYCGVVYRTSGGHVDCSRGYRTCGEDGGWGPCLGDAIYLGD